MEDGEGKKGGERAAGHSKGQLAGDWKGLHSHCREGCSILSTDRRVPRVILVISVNCFKTESNDLPQKVQECILGVTWKPKPFVCHNHIPPPYCVHLARGTPSLSDLLVLLVYSVSSSPRI